ncbi:MAG: diacylglycerol kinase family lipid kinase [Anaerolineae bacterium]|nr:diacylglycerol kinase family lipid kinase [Anaerolineae bacterium]
MYKHIHIIVNPASGQDRPVLAILNSVFHPAGVDWDVFITKQAGDARRLAREAIAAGVDAVGVYGGDGTVMEVVSGLVGTSTPLAIFPGGTGNVASFELGIPGDLAEASALVCSDETDIRQVDLGQVGDTYFILSAGVGLPTSMMQAADREAKDRLGMVAYLAAGLQAFREPLSARYHLTLDGKSVETEGITCLIANSGAIGQLGLKFVQAVDVSDGLLDVIVIRQGDPGSLLSVAASVITGADNAQPLQHWQAREITLVTDPPQAVQVDGEVMGQTPLHVKVVPGAARIIVPKPAPNVILPPAALAY